MLNINPTHDNLLLKCLKVPNFTFAAYFFLFHNGMQRSFPLIVNKA